MARNVLCVVAQHPVWGVGMTLHPGIAAIPWVCCLSANLIFGRSAICGELYLHDLLPRYRPEVPVIVVGNISVGWQWQDAAGDLAGGDVT